LAEAARQVGDLHKAVGSTAAFDPARADDPVRIVADKLAALSPVAIPQSRDEVGGFARTGGRPAGRAAHDGPRAIREPAGALPMMLAVRERRCASACWRRHRLPGYFRRMPVRSRFHDRTIHLFDALRWTASVDYRYRSAIRGSRTSTASRRSSTRWCRTVLQHYGF